MMYGWDFSGGGWLMLAGMAIVAIAIVVSVWLLTSRAGDRPMSTSVPDAIGILRERYARGEITKEEFEEGKRTLG